MFSTLIVNSFLHLACYLLPKVNALKRNTEENGSLIDSIQEVATWKLLK